MASTLRIGMALVLAALALSVVAGQARAVRLPDGFLDRTVAEYLRFPVGMTFLPDGRLLVVEREAGIVQLVVPGPPALVVPVLHVDSIRVDLFEQGLLGVAVDPDWPDRPYAYVYYDALDFTCRIARFRAAGDLADRWSANLTFDPATRYDVMNDIPDESESHNGGTLRFGPDKMLYAGLGDDWTLCAAQDTVSLRGSLLRLDVSTLPDGPGGPADKALLAPPDNPWPTHPDPNARLVWATGFRNPFRFQIDPVDGSVFVTDVGWTSYEEIDRVSAPGENFGWPYYEGEAPMHPSCSPGPGVFFTPPIRVEDRRSVTASVLISGGVYRPASCADCNFPPEYDGDYFYSDYYRGFIRRLRRSESGWSIAPAVPGQPSALNWAEDFIEVTDFAIGPDGALWYCRTNEAWRDYSGHIGRIFPYVPGPASVESETPGESFAPPSPSPARDHVQFSFSMARPGPARIEVFDPAGRWIATVLDAPLEAGAHRASWAVRAAERRPPAGVYFARLVADGVVRRRRFVIAR